ncbi:uncharacterized protein AKAW2_30532S [Aspergillus luchuensis]|uniref:Uncharacterized protein n=2 Tax=Aspergillus kawachii TaxID=1069201 RepID=A0A7R7W6D2_ASPKA|nr:uncharacterized protein AKAW2_30532S [Aspergillus luchuensis]BCR97213.1 hypothetical protein AKAW2_30532S [Aspergillus luchuensis]BCS09680.1 hypothetical protein ALUC_30497S [Aspergillus luchuensis]
MHFIISTDNKKPDRNTRRLIRSHVMQGINKGRPRYDRRKKPYPIQQDQIPSPQSAEVYQDPNIIPSTSKLVVGPDPSFAQFAVQVDSGTFADILQFAKLSMQMFFPLGFLIEFDYRDKSWFHDSIRSDAAYLHLTVCASEVFMCSVHGRQHSDELLSNRRTMLHFTKGVQILRERLTGVDLRTKISDFTVRTVLMLAMTAHLMGESEVAQKHMEGIRTIMDLRGGLRLFESQKILIELFRWDLGLALQNNTTPIFFRDTFLEPLTPFPTIFNPTPSQTNNPQLHLDPTLKTTFHVLQNFCTLINTSITETPQRRLTPDIMPSTLSSVMYRLLQLPFPPNSNNETFRLGLLTFCHHTFLQWQDKTLPFVFFPASYQPHLLSFMGQCQQHPDDAGEDEGEDSLELILWLLMVGILALPPLPAFQGTDLWLRGCLREWLERVGIRTWGELREIMKRFLWVDLMHDFAGEGVFGDVLKV